MAANRLALLLVSRYSVVLSLAWLHEVSRESIAVSSQHRGSFILLRQTFLSTVLRQAPEVTHAVTLPCTHRWH